MLLRELLGGDPPRACKLFFVDEPTGFGYRVVDGGFVVEQVLTKHEEFEHAVAEKTAAGFMETERSLTRRVFVNADRFWIVWLDDDTLGTHSGGIQPNWRESLGQTKSKAFRDRTRAVAAYHKAVADKLADGYLERYERPVTIVAVPKALRKPGKKKSR